MESNVSEAVLEAGRALDIPEAVTRAFVRRLRPCVHLCPYGSLPEELKKDARPAARALGPVHLPEGAEAPLHLPHLMTIDCAAIPAGSLDIAFPADGHLVVFGSVTNGAACGVIHVPAGTETVERQPDKKRMDPYETYHDPFPLYAVPGTTTEPGAQAGGGRKSRSLASGSAGGCGPSRGTGCRLRQHRAPDARSP
ncbi:hypothetical protein PV415_38835 [Streptomyces sp. ME03-5684b]|uniref:hypothetical protein n=1 Tax=Streptomyces sp. ME03-5684b TaxID=3028681 RepID=UPI0029B23F76|nr:hypothetical protein [Streptomyces sp. ME03-5684b]MDX3322856.1 hypothetical protein [Streptomyces sp. ME03-5684b]